MFRYDTIYNPTWQNRISLVVLSLSPDPYAPMPYIHKALGYRYLAEPTTTTSTALKLPNDMKLLHQEMQRCQLCPLSKTRRHVVLQEHSVSQSDLFIAVDIPTINDDMTGVLFSGKSGEMLKKMVENVLEIPYQKVYKSALVKCHTPNRVAPTPQELAQCKDYLLHEIRLIKPKVVVVMGILS